MSFIARCSRRALLSAALLLAPPFGCATDPDPPPNGSFFPDPDVTTPSPSTADEDSSTQPALDGGPDSDAGVGAPDSAMGGEPESDSGTEPQFDASGPAEPDAGDGDVGDQDAGQEPEVPGWDEREDQGEGDGADVVTIGDSWMSNTLFTGDALEGALRRLGKRYRNHGVQGVMLLSSSLFGPAIPTQFDDAVRANPNIKTVVMTGGGNDIIQSPGLQEDCANGGEACKKKLQEIGNGLKALWAKMANAGVEDVVYVGYASDAGSSGEDAANANNNGVAALCAAAPLHCHLIDSTPLVMGQFTDDIHPTRAANDRLAAAILDLMRQRKVRR